MAVADVTVVVASGAYAISVSVSVLVIVSVLVVLILYDRLIPKSSLSVINIHTHQCSQPVVLPLIYTQLNSLVLKLPIFLQC